MYFGQQNIVANILLVSEQNYGSKKNSTLTDEPEITCRKDPITVESDTAPYVLQSTKTETRDDVRDFNERSADEIKSGIEYPLPMPSPKIPENHIDDRNGAKNKSTGTLTKPRQLFWMPSTAERVKERSTSAIVDYAIEKDIVKNFVPHGLSSEAIVNPSEYLMCTMICMKLQGDDCRQSLHNLSDADNFFSVVDAAAGDHKIVSLRRFGGVWFGCLGHSSVFSWGSPEKNTIQAFRFACEIEDLAAFMKLRLVVAVDVGALIWCGFGGGTGFDAMGPELRWVNGAVRIFGAGTILFNDTAYRLVKESEEIRAQKIKVSVTRGTLAVVQDESIKTYCIASHENLDKRTAAVLIALISTEDRDSRTHVLFEYLRELSDSAPSGLKRSLSSKSETIETNLDLDDYVVDEQGCVVTGADVMRVMDGLIGLSWEVRQSRYLIVTCAGKAAAYERRFSAIVT